MSLVLEELKITEEKQLKEMLDEWTNYNNTHNTNRSPFAIFQYDYHNFKEYFDKLNSNKTLKHEIYVPSTTYFLKDTTNNKFIGALNFRHYLNDKLLFDSGHVGLGIRPSERGKKYGNIILSLALEYKKEFNIDKILITCNKDNLASHYSIIHNGGIKENEVVDLDGNIIERFWI